MELNLLELKDKRALITEKAEQIITLAESEKRKLTDEEDKEFKSITTEISNITNKIALAESRSIEQPIKLNEVKTIEIKKENMKNFSLLKAIEARTNGNSLSEEMRAVVEAGKEEMRKSGQTASGDIVLPLEFRADVLAGTATQGQEVVAEQKFAILEPLRESLVLVQAGATMLTGLVGDVSIPTYAGTTAAWKGEVVSAADGAGAFGEVTLSPKRLTAYIDISKQFLNQDSAAAEAMLMKDIVNAIAGKLEATVFGKEAGDATKPAGLFAVAPTIKGAASFENVVALETAIDAANANLGNMKYITNAGGKGILKTTPKVAGQPVYILDGNEMNGYSVLYTNHVAKELQVGADEFGVAFGNWSEYVIGQWGAIDLIVDPYTVAKEGKVRLVINAYFDAKPRRDVALAVASIK